MRRFVESLPPGIIYAHNGGRFDIFYIMEWVAGNEMRVINSRVIKAKMLLPDGEAHQLRDSYAIMPFALGSYKGSKRKLDIDITKLEGDVRETHRAEILDYLERDCVLLWELTTAFHQKFGDKLTIGSTAMKELSKFHRFQNLSSSWDWYIRGGKKKDGSTQPGYYYGGRVECFTSGVQSGDFKVYDVNSMYPFVMQSIQHPIGTVSTIGREITPSTCFIKVRGRNHGAFPSRTKSGGIIFNARQGTFTVTIHEYRMALKYGLFETHEILETIDFEQQGTFAEFVDTYYAARLASKALDDAVNEVFYKLILNSAYGKFSQNPDKYEDNIICRAGWEHGPEPRCDCFKDDCECGGWRVKQMSILNEHEHLNYWTWRCNSSDVSRFNVATGASITGASRALLMEAIHLAKRCVYTDTDCVICEELPLLSMDAKKLGAWKLEAEGTAIALGGKKLYALLDLNHTRNQARILAAEKSGKKLEWVTGGALCVKKANKGVRVTAQEIVDIARGQTVMSFRDAPSFKLDGSYRFIKRRVRATV